jgi:ankyrin repeat protein
VTESADRVAEFLEAATWHGTLDKAEAMLAGDPALAGSGIHAAAVLGDDAAVQRILALDRASATRKAPPYDRNALVYLGLSKYLRLDPVRSPAFLRAATALLDAGADANSGFMTGPPNPEFETALYGATGVAHHAGLTRLLLERGADPNDDEACYHGPEGYENDALKLLVETGKVTPGNLVMMLIRKHDWHDYEGAKYLLDHGAQPNLEWRMGVLPIHHAIARDNDLEFIELLLDRGADPMRRNNGLTAIERAARRGRSDILESLERRQIPLNLEGVDRLIAACARNDSAAVRAMARAEPALRHRVLAEGGQLLAEFVGVGNTGGVRLLLDIGVNVGALFAVGDGYWDFAPDSSALHVAAWRSRPDTVRLLIDRGAAVNARDGRGRTPLMLAVKACVDSYWTERRTPESVQALLAAGASIEGVPVPCGYAAVDALLERHGRGG